MKTLMMCFVAAHLTMAGLANAQSKDASIGKRDFTRHGTVFKVEGDEGRTTNLTHSGRDQSSPLQSSLFQSRGKVQLKSGEGDNTIADYDEAIRIDPMGAVAYYNRGVAWGDKKDYDKAIADYTEAIRIAPKFALAYNGRGNAWSDKKDYDKAIADYNEAIRIDPMDAETYFNRGLAWSQKQDYDKAIADYNEAIRIDPKDAWAYNGRAWLWATCPDEKFRDGKKGVESATRACELADWKDANHLDTLAAAYAESGEFDKAVEWQEKANTLYTDVEDRKEGEERLKLYKEKKPYRDTND